MANLLIFIGGPIAGVLIFFIVVAGPAERGRTPDQRTVQPVSTSAQCPAAEPRRQVFCDLQRMRDNNRRAFSE